MKPSILLCASLIAVPTGPVIADPVTGTEAVSYADLNLGSPAGQHRLLSRINSAAYRVCLTYLPASPSPAFADPVCLRAAIREARLQMARAVAQAARGREIANAH